MSRSRRIQMVTAPRVLQIGILVVFVCGCLESESRVGEYKGTLVAAGPEDHIDDQGRVWRHTRKVTEFSRGPIGSQRDDRPEKDTVALETLPTEELAKRLRPVMITESDDEYVLDEAHALEFARAIQEAARTLPIEAPSSGPTKDDGSTDPRFPKQITGGIDNRIPLDGLASSWPFILIARMNGASYGHFCTGFKMINQHTMVTAAHCLHDRTNWFGKPQIQFGAGGSAPMPNISGGSGGCITREVSSGWISNGGVENDYAVIRLHGFGASCSLSDYNVGWFGYVTTGYLNYPTRLAGYPSKTDDDNPDAPPPGNWSYPRSYYEHTDTGVWTSPGAYTYWNDSSAGQSGGPVYNPTDQVIAINKGGHNNYNWGRAMSPTVVQWFIDRGGY